MIRKIRHLLPNQPFEKDLHSSNLFSLYMEYGHADWSGGNISVFQKLQDRFCRENQVTLSPVQARLN